MGNLSNEHVLQKIQARFAGHITNSEESYGMLNVTVHKDHYYELVKWLKEEEEINCMFLTDLTAVHYPDRKNEELCVVVHLHNLLRNFRIRVKAYVPASHPSIKSLCSLHKAANWMERETFDFYGVHFNGHPNLARILNVEDMNYHPLLKQYPLEDQTREDKNNKYFGR